MAPHPVVADVMRRREARGLHIRVTGIPGRAEPFDYYAKDEADKADFLRRCTANGYTVTIHNNPKES